MLIELLTAAPRVGAPAATVLQKLLPLLASLIGIGLIKSVFSHLFARLRRRRQPWFMPIVIGLLISLAVGALFGYIMTLFFQTNFWVVFGLVALIFFLGAIINAGGRH